MSFDKLKLNYSFNWNEDIMIELVLIREECFCVEDKMLLMIFFLVVDIVEWYYWVRIC